MTSCKITNILPRISLKLWAQSFIIAPPRVCAIHLQFSGLRSKQDIVDSIPNHLQRFEHII